MSSRFNRHSIARGAVALHLTSDPTGLPAQAAEAERRLHERSWWLELRVVLDMQSLAVVRWHEVVYIDFGPERERGECRLAVVSELTSRSASWGASAHMWGRHVGWLNGRHHQQCAVDATKRTHHQTGTVETADWLVRNGRRQPISSCDELDELRELCLHDSDGGVRPVRVGMTYVGFRPPLPSAIDVSRTSTTPS